MQSPPKTQQIKPPVSALKSKCNPEACAPSAASPDKAKLSPSGSAPLLLLLCRDSPGWLQGPRPAGAAASPSPLRPPWPRSPPPAPRAGRPPPSSSSPAAPSPAHPWGSPRAPLGAGTGRIPPRTQPGLGCPRARGSQRGCSGLWSEGRAVLPQRRDSQHRILL